ncbi:MAG: 3-deoxy-D-manno-octulosonic acid transferase, partial [Bacteroidales bacterium]
AHESYQLDFMIRFREDKKLIVAGSTWEPDELLLKDLFPTIAGNYKIVIAPHLIDKEHIKNIKEKFVSYKVLCYSEITDQDLSSYQILIIDTIGLLSKLYKYSYLSYIGGAFETGLHNILEAAVFGVPLFFGPHYAKFNEAVSLVNLQGAFSICGYNELLDKIKLYHDHPEAYQQVCEICCHFVHANLGACDKIWNKIKH